MNTCCTVAGCDKPRLARGWCSMHYQRWKTHGNPNSPARRYWDGRCLDCNNAVVAGDSRRCRSCLRAKNQRYRAANVDRVRLNARVYAKQAHQKRRILAIKKYGNKCRCCGETQLAFLVLDHVKGGGNAHRRTLTRSGEIAGSSNFYAWVVRNNFPKGFQVLCHNCNFAKSHGGCPHKRKKT